MLQQLDSEMARVTERMSISQAELRRLAAERAEQESVITARQAKKYPVLEQTRVQLEQQICGSPGIAGRCGSVAKMRPQTSSQRVARVAALGERHRSANAVLDGSIPYSRDE
jgi:hypothetical protein